MYDLYAAHESFAAKLGLAKIVSAKTVTVATLLGSSDEKFSEIFIPATPPRNTRDFVAH